MSTIAVQGTLVNNTPYLSRAGHAMVFAHLRETRRLLLIAHGKLTEASQLLIGAGFATLDEYESIEGVDRLLWWLGVGYTADGHPAEESPYPQWCRVCDWELTTKARVPTEGGFVCRRCKTKGEVL